MPKSYPKRLPYYWFGVWSGHRDFKSIPEDSNVQPGLRLVTSPSNLKSAKRESDFVFKCQTARVGCWHQISTAPLPASSHCPPVLPVAPIKPSSCSKRFFPFLENSTLRKLPQDCEASCSSCFAVLVKVLWSTNIIRFCSNVIRLQKFFQKDQRSPSQGGHCSSRGQMEGPKF